MPLYDFRCAEGHHFERFVALAQFTCPQVCGCGAPSQRMIAAPMVLSDAIEPRMGADGKMHDSLSAYRHSLTPEGNPRGERYFELGNERLKTVEQKVDRKALRDDIRKSVEEVKQGRRVAPVTGEVT